MAQGGAAAQQAQQASFPPMQQSDAVRYQSMFQQMDNDRDGFVQVHLTYTSALCLTQFVSQP